MPVLTPGEIQTQSLVTAYRAANPGSTLTPSQIRQKYYEGYGPEGLKSRGFGAAAEEHVRVRSLNEMLARRAPTIGGEKHQAGTLEQMGAKFQTAKNRSAATWEALIATGLDTVGADSWAKSFAEESQMDMAQANEQSKIGTGLSVFGEDGSNLQGTGDYWDYAWGTLAELAPFALEIAATGAAGAALGSTIGPEGTVGGAVWGSTVGRGVARRALQRRAKQILATDTTISGSTRSSLDHFRRHAVIDELTDDALRAIGDDAFLATSMAGRAEKAAITSRLSNLGVGTTHDSAKALFNAQLGADMKAAGAYGGTMIGSGLLEGGGTMVEYAESEDMPVNKIGFAKGLQMLGMGMISGAAEILPAGMVIRRVFARPVSAGVSRNLYQKMKPALASAVKGAGVEGVTEMAQEYINTASFKLAKGFEDPFNPTDEEKRHINEAGIKGAIGGVFLPAMGTVGRKAYVAVKGEEDVFTTGDALDKIYDKHTSYIEGHLDPEYVEDEAAPVEGEEIDPAKSYEPSPIRKRQIKKLVIDEINLEKRSEAGVAPAGEIESGKADIEARRNELLIDVKDREVYSQMHQNAMAAELALKQRKISQLAKDEVVTGEPTDEEASAFKDRKNVLLDTDDNKSFYNKERLRFLKIQRENPMNLEGISGRDQVLQEMNIHQRKEAYGEIGSEVALRIDEEGESKTLKELKDEAKSQAERDIIQYIIDFESLKDPEVIDEWMDLVLPNFAQSPKQEALARYLLIRFPQESILHNTRLEEANRMGLEDTPEGKEHREWWASNIADIMHKWQARAVDEVLPSDIDEFQLNHLDTTLTETESQFVNSAIEELEGEGVTAPTKTQVVDKANKMLKDHKDSAEKSLAEVSLITTKLSKKLKNLIERAAERRDKRVTTDKAKARKLPKELVEGVAGLPKDKPEGVPVKTSEDVEIEEAQRKAQSARAKLEETLEKGEQKAELPEGLLSKIKRGASKVRTKTKEKEEAPPDEGAGVSAPTWKDLYNMLPEGSAGRKAVDKQTDEGRKLTLARNFAEKRRTELATNKLKGEEGSRSMDELKRLEGLLHQEKAHRALAKAREGGTPIQILAALYEIQEGRPLSDSDLQQVFDEGGFEGVRRYLQKRGGENINELLAEAGLAETKESTTTEAKPKRVTLNNLNEYLQSKLPNLELVKGKEYFYFADLPDAPTSKLPDSIFVAKLGTNWKSWISDLDNAVAQWNKENAPVAEEKPAAPEEPAKILEYGLTEMRYGELEGHYGETSLFTEASISLTKSKGKYLLRGNAKDIATLANNIEEDYTGNDQIDVAIKNKRLAASMAKLLEKLRELVSKEQAEEGKGAAPAAPGKPADPGKPASPGKPTESEFDTYQAYQDALDVWKKAEEEHEASEVGEDVRAPEKIRNLSSGDKHLLYSFFRKAVVAVRLRTSYGGRVEEASRPGYMLTWSNEQAKWLTTRKVKMGQSIKLDANMILIEARNKTEAEVIAENLPQLPLHEGSTEAAEETGTLAQAKSLAARLSPNSEQYKKLEELYGEDLKLEEIPSDVDAVLKFMDYVDPPGQKKGKAKGKSADKVASDDTSAVKTTPNKLHHLSKQTPGNLAKEWETKSIHMTTPENLPAIAKEGLVPQTPPEQIKELEKAGLPKEVWPKALYFLGPHSMKKWDKKLRGDIMHIVASTAGAGFRSDPDVAPTKEELDRWGDRMASGGFVILGFEAPGYHTQDEDMAPLLGEANAELSRVTDWSVPVKDISVWTDDGWVSIAEYVEGRNLRTVAEASVEEEIKDESQEPGKPKKPKRERTDVQKSKAAVADKKKNLEKIEKKLAELKAIRGKLELLNNQEAPITLTPEEASDAELLDAFEAAKAASPLTEEQIDETAEKLADINDVHEEIEEETGEQSPIDGGGEVTSEDRRALVNQLLEAHEDGKKEETGPTPEDRRALVNRMLGQMDDTGSDPDAFSTEELNQIADKYDAKTKEKRASRGKTLLMDEALVKFRRAYVRALREGSEGLTGTFYTTQDGTTYFHPEEFDDVEAEFQSRPSEFIMLVSEQETLPYSVRQFAEDLGVDGQYTFPPPGESMILSGTMIFGYSDSPSLDEDSGQAIRTKKNSKSVKTIRAAKARVDKARGANIPSLTPIDKDKVEDSGRELSDDDLARIAVTIIDDADLNFEGVATRNKRGRLFVRVGPDMVHIATSDDISLDRIARYYGVTAGQLEEYNNIAPGTALKYGTKLLIPTPKQNWWKPGRGDLSLFLKSAGGTQPVKGNKGLSRRAVFLRNRNTGLIHLSMVTYDKEARVENPEAKLEVKKKNLLVSTPGFLRPNVDPETLDFIEGTNEWEILSMVRLKEASKNIKVDFGDKMPPLTQSDYDMLTEFLEIKGRDELRNKEKTKRGRIEGSAAWTDKSAGIGEEQLDVTTPMWAKESLDAASKIPGLTLSMGEKGVEVLTQFFYSMRRDRPGVVGYKGRKGTTLPQLDLEQVRHELEYFYTQHPDILEEHIMEVYLNEMYEVSDQMRLLGKPWPLIENELVNMLPKKPRSRQEWLNLMGTIVPVVTEVMHQRLNRHGDTTLTQFTQDYGKQLAQQGVLGHLPGRMAPGAFEAYKTHRVREYKNAAAKAAAGALSEIEQITAKGLTNPVKELILSDEQFKFYMVALEFSKEHAGNIMGKPMDLWQLANRLETLNRPETRHPSIAADAKLAKLVRIFNEHVWESLDSAVKRFTEDKTTEMANPSRRDDPNVVAKNEAYLSEVEKLEHKNKVVRTRALNTLNKMVRDEASEVGLSGPVFHGSPTPGFTVFDTSKKSHTWSVSTGKGFHFTTSFKLAQGYRWPTDEHGDRLSIEQMMKLEGEGNLGEVREFFLEGRFFDVDKWYLDPALETLSEDDKKIISAGRIDVEKVNEDAIEWLKSKGYSGIKKDWGQQTDGHAPGVEYVVFDPEQIKSSDPVTYDSDGNVIPLSERFNPQSRDTRFAPMIEEGESPFGYLKDKVGRVFVHTRNVWDQYGGRSELLERDEEYGQLDMAPDGYYIKLGMADVSNPTPENFDNLLEEITHAVFHNLTHNQRRALLGSVTEAMRTLSNQYNKKDAKTGRSLIDGMSDKEVADLLKEEQLVRDVLNSIAANEEIPLDEKEAKAGIRKILNSIITFLKDAIDRMIIAVRGDRVDPDVANRFLARRVVSFISGAPMPSNIMDALGMRMPEDRLKPMIPTSQSKPPVTYNTKSDNYVYEHLLPVDGKAAEANVLHSSVPQEVHMSKVQVALQLANAEFENLSKDEQESISNVASDEYIAQTLKYIDSLVDGVPKSRVEGVVSKLNARDWKTVRTQFFRRWAGESVIMDEETGEPLKVWHVTPADQVEKRVQHDYQSGYDLPFDELNPGSYVAVSKDWVDGFAREIAGPYSKDAPIFLGGFIRANKVLDLGGLQGGTTISVLGTIETKGVDFEKHGGKESVADEINGFLDRGKGVRGPESQMRSTYQFLHAKPLIDILTEAGFDAIKLTEPPTREPGARLSQAYMLLDGGNQFKATVMQDWRNRDIALNNSVYSESTKFRFSPSRMQRVRDPAYFTPSSDVEQANRADVDIAANNFIMDMVEELYRSSAAAGKILGTEEDAKAKMAEAISLSILAAEKVGATGVSPTTRIDDLSGESLQNSAFSALRMLDRARKKTSDDSHKAGKEMDRSLDIAVKKQQKLNDLTRMYKDLDWNFRQMWEEFGGMVKELRKETKILGRQGTDASALSQMLGKMEATLKEPAGNRLTVLNRLLKENYGKTFSGFNVLVEEMSRFSDDIIFDRIPGETPGEAVSRVGRDLRDKSHSLSGKVGLSEIMAAFMISNTLHVDLLRIRKMTVQEGQEEIIAAIKEAKIQVPAKVDEIAKKAKTSVSNRNMLTRVLMQVNKAKKDVKDATGNADNMQNQIDFNNESWPVYMQARIALEKILGTKSQFYLHNDTPINVPPGPNTNPADVMHEDNMTVYHKEKYRSHEDHIRRMNIWIGNVPEHERGETYRLIQQQRDALMQDFVRDTLDAETHWTMMTYVFSRMLKMMPITARMRQTGLYEGTQMTQMMNEYINLREKSNDLSKFGQKFTLRMSRAMSAMKIDDEDVFFGIFYDQAMKHIENNKDQLANLGEDQQVSSGISMLKKHFFNHRDMATQKLARDNWVLLEEFYKATAAANTALRGFVDGLGAGAMVEEKIGDDRVYRSMIGNVWTISRGFGGDIHAILYNMRPIWSEAKSPFRTDVKYDFQKEYEANREKFAEVMSGFFANKDLGPVVHENFVLPFLRKGGVSLVQAPLVKGDTVRKMMTHSQIEKAITSAPGGDIVGLAEAMYAISTEGLSEAQIETPIGKFVGEVLGFYKQVYNNISTAMTESDGSFTGDATPRDLLDARETEAYPSEYLEYNRLDRLRMAAIANRASMHSAFGRDFSDFSRVLDSATQRARHLEILNEELTNSAKESSKTKEQLLEEKKDKIPAYRNLTLKKIASGSNILSELTYIREEFGTFVTLASGRNLDENSGLEVIGSVAGNAVQGPKTIVNDTSALTFNLLRNMGINGLALRTFLAQGKSFIAQSANSLLNASHRELRFELEFGKLAKKYGAVDGTGREVYGQIIRAINSASSNLEIWEAEMSRPMPVEKGTEGETLPARALKGLEHLVVKFARGASTLKLMGAGQKTEGEYNAPSDVVAQPLGLFGTFALIGQLSATHGLAESASYIILKGAEFYAANPSHKGPVTIDMLDGWEGIANDKALGFIRENLMLHGGMNIDSMAREKGEEIRTEGKVTPFIDAEFIRRIYVASQANTTGESTPSTRPTFFLTNKKGRNINMLFGWAVNQSYKGMYEQFREADYSRKAGMMNQVKRLYIPLLMATGSVMLYAALRDELEEKIIGVKSRAIAPWSYFGMLDAIDRVGMFGFAGSVANEVFNRESNRSWSLENRVLAVNTFKSLISLSSRLYQSDFAMTYQNFTRPLVQLMGGGGYLQYAQIINNIFGLNNKESRYSARLNAKNAIISAGKELEMETRKPGMGYTATPVTPWVTLMQISTIGNDTSGFREARENAIQSAMHHRGEDRRDAEKYVDNRFAQDHPFRRAFKTSPTGSDIDKLYNHMSSETRKDVKEAVRLYDHYLNQLGRGGFRGKGESKSRPSIEEALGLTKPARKARTSPSERAIDRELIEYIRGK